MDIDIDKIDTYEQRKKVDTIKWRPIYEVIDKAYFIDSKKSQMLLCNNKRIVQMMLNLSHLILKIS